MFTADLSWVDEPVEKIGERRDRKERQRKGSISSSNSSSNSRLSISRKPSISDKTSLTSFASFRRQSFSKGRGLKKPNLAPIDSGAPIDDDLPPWGNYPEAIGPPLNLDASGILLRSDSASERSRSKFGHHWIISTNNDSKSSWPAHLPVSENEIGSNGYRSETLFSNTSCTKVCMSEVAREVEVREPVELPASSHNGASSPPPRSPLRPTLPDLQAQGNCYLTPTPLEDLPAILQTVTVTVSADSERQEEVPSPPPPPKPKVVALKPLALPKISQWRAPSNWEITPDSTKERQNSNAVDGSISTYSTSPLTTPSSPSSNGVPPDCSTTATDASSHFQRFVRRIEGAGPKIILDRLREEWSDSALDDALRGELALEKHLWALTALQLSAIVDQFMKPGLSPGLITGAPLPPTLEAGRKRKILELDGAIGEIYQLSAMYPDSTIAHLVPSEQRALLPLPSQAQQHPLPGTAPRTSPFLPLPYASSSMHHIRSSRLASLVPSSQLPALLSECHRCLKPGGILELRLIDAAPPRQCLGPELADWLEERVLLNLEAGFRCSRPLALLPTWVRQAGFIPLPSTVHDFVPPGSVKRNGVVRCLRLPAATAASSPSEKTQIVAEVGSLLARALWKDTWGSYVADDEEGEKWWWDAEFLLEECEQFKTVWEVGTLVVVKGN